MTKKEELHCSAYCEQQQYPIIGTGRKPEQSTEFGGYLLVEFPHHWEAKIEHQQGLLGQLATLLEARTRVYRLQAIRDDHSLSTGRLIFYRWEGRGRREEYHLDPSQIVQKLSAVLNGELDPVSSDVTRDLLVCTHAQRDKCCGRFGYPIYQALSAVSQGQTRVWRSSHITGHRAAPTMLDLPLGNFWGYMTEEMGLRLLRNADLTADQIRRHYRGGTLLTPQQQLVDREGFVEHGHAWFDYPPQIKQETSRQVRITIRRGDRAVSRTVRTEPQVVKVGHTYCGQVKDIVFFELVES